MAASFPTQLQQENTRKILEDIQLKKQLLQKSGSITSINQMPAAQAPEFAPSGSVATAPAATRSVFNPNSSPTTLGYFIQQDSFYGNTFIPVLPRFDPLPPTTHHPAK